MELTKDILDTTCFLISTFDEREKFLDPFFYFYKKNIGGKLRIYLVKEKNIFICKENINLKQLNLSIPRTSNNLGMCSSWGKRLKTALKIIKQDGFSYVIFTCDDGWIYQFNINEFNKIIKIFKKHNYDRLQLLEPSTGYIIEELDHDVSLISPKTNVPWYLNHQSSAWRLESLNNIVYSSDCATTNEKEGSERSKDKSYKFLNLNTSAIDSTGVNHYHGGLSKNGQKMLNEYCEAKGLNYKNYIKINKFVPYHKNKMIISFLFNKSIMFVKVIFPENIYNYFKKIYKIRKIKNEKF